MYNRKEYFNLEVEHNIKIDKYIANLCEEDMVLQRTYCNNVEIIMKRHFQFKDMNYFREKYKD